MELSLANPPALALAPIGILVLLLLRRRGQRLYVERHTYLNPLARHIQAPPRPRRRLGLLLSAMVVVLVALAAADPVVKVYREETLKTGYTGRLEIPSTPGVVLVIDVSGSMGGAKIATAKDAMLRFISLLNKTVDLGLVAFNTEIVSAVPPTDNWTAVEEAIRALEARGGTMYTFPLTTAMSWLEVYREYGLPAVIVMATDGLPADLTQYREVVREIGEKGIKVYTVFIGRDPQGVRETRFIARATGGKQYTASEIGDLVGILEEIANETNRIVANVTVKARVTVRREHRVPLAPPLYAASLILVAALSYQRYRASRLTI